MVGDVEPVSGRRLNYGCGPVTMAGWIGLDRDESWHPDVVADATETGVPLPFDDDSIELIVANHAVQMVPWHFLGRLFREWRRVLEPAGAVRILVPDTLGAFAAHAAGEHRWFPIADHVAESIDSKLSAYLTWYSEARCCHTFGSLEQHLRAAGFETVVRMPYGQTDTGLDAIVELDTRAHESLIVEAW